MRRVERTDVLTMRRFVAVVGAAMSLLAIPAIAASAAPSPAPTPTASSAATTKSGISLQLGGLSLNVPLALNIPGILQIGSPPSATSTPPTSPPPSSGGSSTTPAPPTSSHQSTPATSHPPTTSAAPPPPVNSGSAFVPPPAGHTSSTSTHPSSHPPTSSASSSTASKGTGSLVLTQRLLSDRGQVMIAALLAATAIAVIAFARLGGVRRSRRTPREH